MYKKKKNDVAQHHSSFWNIPYDYFNVPLFAALIIASLA